MANQLKFWDNGNDIVIAESAEDAAKVWGETTGQTWEDYLRDEDGNATWGEYVHQNATLFLEDEEDAIEMAPEGAQIAPTENGAWWSVKASTQEWANKLGRCFFGSDNW